MLGSDMSKANINEGLAVLWSIYAVLLYMAGLDKLFCLPVVVVSLIKIIMAFMSTFDKPEKHEEFEEHG